MMYHTYAEQCPRLTKVECFWPARKILFYLYLGLTNLSFDLFLLVTLTSWFSFQNGFLFLFGSTCRKQLVLYVWQWCPAYNCKRIGILYYFYVVSYPFFLLIDTTYPNALPLKTIGCFALFLVRVQVFSFHMSVQFEWLYTVRRTN